MNFPAWTIPHRMLFTTVAVLLGLVSTAPPAPGQAPRSEERQLPRAMHSEMSERPTIRVGRTDGDILGADHRALQAAVDYIAGLGGGVVEIGPGEFLMRDSLHLRSHVTVRGTPGQTTLRQADAAISPLALDGDFGEQQVTVQDATGFDVGAGVAIWDDHSGGFHTTVARITGRRGNTFSIDTPLMADCMVANHAQAATVFPIVSGSHIEGAQVEDLIIEGSRSTNPPLNGCRGAGIYLYRGFGTVIRRCVVRNYPGDGISFQQSNDVTIADCVSEDNAELGFHPGSGSQRPILRGNLARRNGTDGLFLCWRVRHGLFENNRLEANGRFGISIGHKDSDNLLRGNHVVNNGSHGIFFRDESEGMAPHRNRLIGNVIEENGKAPGTAGIRIRGEPSDLLFQENVIRDPRRKPPGPKPSESSSKTESAPCGSRPTRSTPPPPSTTADQVRPVPHRASPKSTASRVPGKTPAAGAAVRRNLGSHQPPRGLNQRAAADRSTPAPPGQAVAVRSDPAPPAPSSQPQFQPPVSRSQEGSIRQIDVIFLQTPAAASPEPPPDASAHEAEPHEPSLASATTRSGPPPHPSRDRSDRQRGQSRLGSAGGLVAEP